MYFQLFFVLVCLCKCNCLNQEDEQEHCDELKRWLESSTVSLEFSKKGFHREVTATVELRPGALSGASVLLLYRWPSGVFVDPYQLASLRDQSNWEILLDSAIDLELPAHKTSGFLTYVFPSNTGPAPSVLQVTIPVHGRYHEPSFAGETFTSVHIEPPELLLRTEKCTDLHRFESRFVLDAPCTVSNSSTCSWVKKTLQQEPSTMGILLPVGDGSATKLICGGTLLVTMICCVTLSKYMLERRII
ncbi:phosphatidylinositol-glycan biosynthesis class X protein isoform X1 [Fundulus heteroclitus]|uniref:phosphatidylinositol-glycan biosynthesis class X protein isoform X1 n=1 Tax=Fundulus heteroclitus TaxID=8078 RepID=UPI00165C1872|nr:phosphatidylinositol-glycan biosynthesis class X protein isoform X1 [Fundulus heteroclitus]